MSFEKFVFDARKVQADAKNTRNGERRLGFGRLETLLTWRDLPFQPNNRVAKTRIESMS